MPKRKKAAPTKTNGAAVAKAPPAEPEAESVPDFSSLAKMFEDAARVEAAGGGLKSVDVECPYCGEDFEILVEPAEEGQEVVQDCRACCKPITFAVEMEEGELSVAAYRE